MTYNLEEAKTICDNLVEKMTSRGVITPSAAIEVRSNRRDIGVTLNFAKAGDRIAGDYAFFYSESAADAVAQARAWIRAQPTAEERALQNALDLTAKALEASRKAGLDTGEGAAFIAQLEAMMKRLSENAITDQSGAT